MYIRQKDTVFIRVFYVIQSTLVILTSSGPYCMCKVIVINIVIAFTVLSRGWTWRLFIWYLSFISSYVGCPPLLL